MLSIGSNDRSFNTNDINQYQGQLLSSKSQSNKYQENQNYKNLFYRDPTNDPQHNFGRYANAPHVNKFQHNPFSSIEWNKPGPQVSQRKFYQPQQQQQPQYGQYQVQTPQGQVIQQQASLPNLPKNDYVIEQPPSSVKQQQTKPILQQGNVVIKPQQVQLTQPDQPMSHRAQLAEMNYLQQSTKGLAQQNEKRMTSVVQQLSQTPNHWDSDNYLDQMQNMNYNSYKKVPYFSQKRVANQSEVSWKSNQPPFSPTQDANIVQFGRSNLFECKNNTGTYKQHVDRTKALQGFRCGSPGKDFSRPKLAK